MTNTDYGDVSYTSCIDNSTYMMIHCLHKIEMSDFLRRRDIEYADFIFSEHRRLQGIKVIHTSGERFRDKGWETHITPEGNEVLVPETIDSSKTPFPAHILLVPPELLGTHEATDPNYVPKIDEPQRGFEGINFKDGWSGPPIAVAAHAVCNGNTIQESKIYQSIYDSLSKKGGMGVLENLVYGDLGKLDGHHRSKMAIYGPIKLKFVPVQIIPYLYDPNVILDTWHNDGNVWTAQQVFECFKEPEKYAESKRTKFGVRGTDGVVRRILDTQPDIRIPLENLL